MPEFTYVESATKNVSIVAWNIDHNLLKITYLLLYYCT